MKRYSVVGFLVTALMMVALISIIGCGDTGIPSGNPNITGPDDDGSGITEIVGIRKVIHHDQHEVRTMFYLVSDLQADKDLPILVTYDDKSSEFVVIREGFAKSEEFRLSGKTYIEEPWMRAKVNLPVDVKGGGQIPYNYDFRQSLYEVDKNYSEVK